MIKKLDYLSGDRQPPSDELRLAMFLDLAADYVNLVRTMPLPRKITWGGQKRLTDAERWVIVLHATLLRKFFKDPAVQVGQVVASTRRLLRADAHADLIAALIDIESRASAHDAPTGMRLQVGQLPISGWEAAQVQLHGRHIHADYLKWRNSNEHPLGDAQYMQSWASAAASVVRTLVSNLRYAWNQGQLRPGVDLAEWFERSRWGMADQDPTDGDPTT